MGKALSRLMLFLAGILIFGFGVVKPIGAQTKVPAPFLGETWQEFNARAGGLARNAERQQSLHPFVGETSRDFEARRRGEPPDIEPALVTIAADANGHFFVDCILNGQPMRMVVDTGATVVSLSHEDAELAGIHVSETDYVQKVMTANGIVRAAPVRIGEIRVEDILVRDVEAVVLPPGNLTLGLLGMSFLKQLRAFEMSQGRLLLRG